MPDQHRLRAAQGWLELGNHQEAAAELEDLTPAARAHPAVLELRWSIHAKAKDWTRCVEIGQAQSRVAPENASSWINVAFALHELKRTEEARQMLLSILERFPAEWIVPYNLACYCCQLGDLTGSRDWLAQALKLGDAKQIRAQALDDPDLAPLWDELTG